MPHGIPQTAKVLLQSSDPEKPFEVLIFEPSDPGTGGKEYHDIPGGNIDAGEDPLDGLRREVREELPGVELHHAELVCTEYRYDSNGRPTKAFLCYLGRASFPKEIIGSFEHPNGPRWYDVRSLGTLSLKPRYKKFGSLARQMIEQKVGEAAAAKALAAVNA